MELLRTVTLVVATMTTGLMAGVFGLYSHTIMPGLRSTDDRTFVGAFQSIDRAIVNPLFMTTFFAALVTTGLALVLDLRADDRSLLAWIGAALVLYLTTVAVTIGINVPLNDEIKAAGAPAQIVDLAAVRTHFGEQRWAAWNLARALMSTAAFGCLTWALVLHGRTTG